MERRPPAFFILLSGRAGITRSKLGGGGDYFLQVWAKAPSFSGTGVFLNPTGVVNAASNSPFTAQISPGEVISLYGTGFPAASQILTAPLPFPTNLGGIQVMINGVAAPVYAVSPGQVNAVVPYSTPSDGIIGEHSSDLQWYAFKYGAIVYWPDLAGRFHRASWRLGLWRDFAREF